MALCSPSQRSMAAISTSLSLLQRVISFGSNLLINYSWARSLDFGESWLLPKWKSVSSSKGWFALRRNGVINDSAKIMQKHIGVFRESRNSHEWNLMARVFAHETAGSFFATKSFNLWRSPCCPKLALRAELFLILQSFDVILEARHISSDGYLNDIIV